MEKKPLIVAGLGVAALAIAYGVYVAASGSNAKA